MLASAGVYHQVLSNSGCENRVCGGSREGQVHWFSPGTQMNTTESPPSTNILSIFTKAIKVTILVINLHSEC